MAAATTAFACRSPGRHQSGFREGARRLATAMQPEMTTVETTKTIQTHVNGRGLTIRTLSRVLRVYRGGGVIRSLSKRRPGSSSENGTLAGSGSNIADGVRPITRPSRVMTTIAT